MYIYRTALFEAVERFVEPKVRSAGYSAVMLRVGKGHIEQLPSGSFRVSVYAGIDPITRRRIRLRATAKDELHAQIELGRLLKEALNLAPALKNSAFEDEAEFRLHLFLSPDKDLAHVKFRESEVGVTPYVEIPLCEPGGSQIAVIKEIVIGPQRHPNESRRAIRMLLDANGLTGVGIRISEIPLRA
jgi:hypothetical protein